ncbi:hypothetical protein LCGC14_2495880 [marine sediment metagenome]|uniref:Uncharacterized protein n=1 Tax=marine sediment metagenome TaxID=412755 RepID=A0A0F9B3A8_9ZZZZ
MPRDLPDWHTLSAQSSVYEVTDLGELAVRLGSIVTFDRRGDVIWIDGFEDGKDKWVTVTSGSGSAVDAATDRSRNGQNSVRLTPGTDLSKLATLRHDHAIPVFSLLGAEFSFSILLTVADLKLSMRTTDGAQVRTFAIRWRKTEKDLQYLDDNNIWVTFATDVVMSAGGSLFHTVKLVIDAVNGFYVRAIINDNEYSLVDIAPNTNPSAVAPFLRLDITDTGTGGGTERAWIDDVILTQNEPAQV